MNKQEKIDKLIDDISKLNDSISILDNECGHIHKYETNKDKQPNYYKILNMPDYFNTKSFLVDIRLLLTALKAERETLTSELGVLLGQPNASHYDETENDIGNVVYVFFANHNFTNGMITDLHCWGHTSNPREVKDRVRYIKEQLWEEVCAMDPDLDEKIIPKSEDDIQVWVVRSSDSIHKPGISEVNLFTNDDTFIL